METSVDLLTLPLDLGPYTLAPMRLEDLAEVLAIERQVFPEPWAPDAYRHELTSNPRGHYLVVRRRPVQSGRRWLPGFLGHRTAPPPPGELLGYAGLWLLVDEGHVSTIAVHPQARGRGLGELLLVALIERAVELQAAIVTLEVRVTNEVAQSLYRKYGFEVVGRRKRYYRSNGEDALIMTVPALDKDYCRRFEQQKQALEARLRG